MVLVSGLWLCWVGQCPQLVSDDEMPWPQLVSADAGPEPMAENPTARPAVSTTATMRRANLLLMSSPPSSGSAPEILFPLSNPVCATRDACSTESACTNVHCINLQKMSAREPVRRG